MTKNTAMQTTATQTAFETSSGRTKDATNAVGEKKSVSARLLMTAAADVSLSSASARMLSRTRSGKEPREEVWSRAYP
jgi:hypothetical protein